MFSLLLIPRIRLVRLDLVAVSHSSWIIRAMLANNEEKCGGGAKTK